MSWTDTYIGIPHLDHGRTRAGLDCWGLLRLVYREELGIDLPSYSEGYVDTEERAEIAELIADQSSRFWVRTSPIRPFDALLFRRGRHAAHVGVAVDARHMLHVENGEQVRIARLNDPRFEHRFKGAFKPNGDAKT